MNIRLAQKEDYPALVALWHQVYPEDQYSAEEFYYLDTVHQEPCQCARYIVLNAERAIASASYMQFIGMYHPQKFMLNVLVAPDYRQQGLGAQLYTHLLAELAPQQPISFRAQVRESLPEAIRFAKQRGFVETKRDWQARLNLANFDGKGYEGLESRLAAEGISVGRMPELSEATTHARLYELYSELRLDVPRSEPATDMSFAQFQELFLNAPDFFADGLHLAVHAGDLIGLTVFWKEQNGKVLHTGLTGVKRPHRSKGLATLLKTKALNYAKSLGFTTVYTDNDSNNTEMIRINDKLGFERQSAWLSMLKELA